MKMKYSLCKVYSKLVLDAFLTLSGLYLVGSKGLVGQSWL